MASPARKTRLASRRETARPKSALRRVADRALLVALAVATVAVLKAFVLDLGIVQGGSMEPTLQPGDRLLVDKLSPRLGRLRHGDIVMVRAPESETLLVKRLVGLPGDEVRAEWGRILVDGEAIGPDDARTPPDYWFPPKQVGPGEVFVLGDNRTTSDDSATWGPIPGRLVVARVMRRL